MEQRLPIKMQETTLLLFSEGKGTVEPIPLTLFQPTQGQWPALVILPSIYGPEEDVKQQARLFAQEGAQVVLVDPFWRVHPGALPYSQEGTKVGLARKEAVHSDDVQRDLTAVLDVCRHHRQSNGRCLVLGICFGGRFAWKAALQQEVEAAILWHAAGLNPFLATVNQLTVPLEHHLGDSDPLIPEDEVAAMQQAMSSFEHLVCHVHPGAVHGFTHTSKQESYDSNATKASIKCVRGWIQTLKTM